MVERWPPLPSPVDIGEAPEVFRIVTVDTRDDPPMVEPSSASLLALLNRLPALA